MPYRLLRALMLVIPRVPLRVLTPVVWLAGGAAWYASRRLRETTTDHMRHALGPGAPRTSIAARARDCVRAATWYWVDLARARRMTPEQTFASLDAVEGLEMLYDAYDEGRGVVLLSAHLGNPEVFAAFLPLLGLRTAIFVEPLADARVHALMQSTRERGGARMLEPDAAGVRAAIAQVRCGAVLGGLADRDVLGGGKPYVFFGERARMPDGLIEIALRLRAPVVAAWVTRTTAGRYEARLERIALPEPSGDRQDDLETAQYAYLGALERAIRRAPGQWFALAPVWRGLQ